MSRDFVGIMTMTTTMTLIVQVRTLVRDAIGDGVLSEMRFAKKYW